jgi:predicted phosphate transport protein (TIGR00153 family)
MLASLFPRSGGEFFEFFERHAAKTLEAAQMLHAMLENPTPDAERQAAAIKSIEHEGDQITHRTMEMLHQTFITPIDRAEIHRLISRLDDILDLVDSTAERIWLYQLLEVQPEALSLANVLIHAVTEVRKAMTQLRNLKDRSAILRTCMEINRYENEGDQLIRKAVARLFREERDAIRVLKWKEIYDYLEDAVDRCEDVANVLEGVALEYA